MLIYLLAALIRNRGEMGFSEAQQKLDSEMYVDNFDKDRAICPMENAEKSDGELHFKKIGK